MPKKPISKPKRGPKPDTLELEGDWEDNIKKAMQKKKPAGGMAEVRKNGPSFNDSFISGVFHAVVLKHLASGVIS